MYPEKVKTLSLKYGVTHIDIRLPEVTGWKSIEEEDYLVEDIFHNMMESPKVEDPHLPDYGVRGHFYSTEVHNAFHVDAEGPHILYITGTTLSTQCSELYRNMFRLPKSLFTSYWEDIYHGYLFQILSL